LDIDAMISVCTCFYIHEHGNEMPKHDQMSWNHKINHQAKLGSTSQDKVLIGKILKSICKWWWNAI